MSTARKARMTLLESARHARLSQLFGPTVSAGAHLTVFALVVYAGSQLDIKATDVPNVIAQFLLPPTRPTPQPVQEQVSYVGIQSVASKEIPQPAVDRTPSTDRPVDPKPVATIATPETKPIEPEHTFTEIDVDSAAARDAESAGPVYPPTLLAAQIEGMALVQFVVDSSGHVEEQSFAIIRTTRPEFAEAVRSILPRMKFKPAWLNGRHVSQLVEQPFNFRIAKSPVVKPKGEK